MLRALKVQYLVIPALPSVQTMWQQKFGFGALGCGWLGLAGNLLLSWVCNRFNISNHSPLVLT